MSTRPRTRHPETWAVWSVLGTRRGRIVLAVLSEAADAVTRDDLAMAVVAHESTAAQDQGRVEHERDVAVDLHHCILPKLAADDLVAYDQESGVVVARDLPFSGDEWLDAPVLDALDAIGS